MSTAAIAQTPLESAVALAREHRWAEARKALEGAVEPSETAPRIAFHRLKAAIASGLGDAKAAAAEMEEAVKISPKDPVLLLAAAVAEFQAGLLNEALRHAHNVPKSAQAMALIGDIQEKRGQYIEAANAYQAAVALEPDREQYRIALALELVEHQSFTAAIAVLKQAAGLFPKSGKIRTLLGVAQYGDGDSAAAMESLADAIAADATLEPAYVYLTRIVLDSSAPPPEPIVKALCRWNSTVCNAIRLRIARAQDDSKLLADAIAGLEHGGQDDPIARCELGRGYQWTGQNEKARTEMEACVKLEPTPQNHYRLGLIYRQLGLTEQAESEIAVRNKAMEAISEDAARRADAVQSFQVVIK